MIVFSDLDGTLLDHADYSFAAAEPALAALRRHAVPLILATSKTRAEVEDVRARLENHDPFIVENGAGIFFPRCRGRPDVAGVEELGAYYRLSCGLAYPEIRDFMRITATQFGARGFGDMSAGEVARRTGLDVDDARCARSREFSEPFVIEDEARLAGLRSAARDAGLAITRGGRFYHLVAQGQDKGKAAAAVVRAIAAGEARLTVGLGDSVNDEPLLAFVDIAVVIPHLDGTHLRLDREDARIASAAGSRGWNDAVLRIVGEQLRDHESSS